VVFESPGQLVGLRECRAFERWLAQSQHRAEFFHPDPDIMHAVLRALGEGFDVLGHARHEAAQNPLHLPARAFGGEKARIHASTD
jgi:hypothetical protein